MCLHFESWLEISSLVVSLPLPPAAAYDECSPVTAEKREVQLAQRVPSWNYTETRQSRAVSLLFVEMQQRGGANQSAGREKRSMSDVYRRKLATMVAERARAYGAISDLLGFVPVKITTLL